MENEGNLRQKLPHYRNTSLCAEYLKENAYIGGSKSKPKGFILFQLTFNKREWEKIESCILFLVYYFTQFGKLSSEYGLKNK